MKDINQNKDQYSCLGNFLYLHVLHIMNVIGGFTMVSITLAVPQELKTEMDRHPEMNWSEVARQAIRERVVLLHKMDKLLSKSKLTEADTLELGRKVNQGLAKRLRGTR